MDRDGKVYFSVSDMNTEEKKRIIETIGASKGMNLTEAEKKNFYANPNAYIRVPFTLLKSYLGLSSARMTGYNQPGIPAQDSTHNELTDWLRAAMSAFASKKITIMVKGDGKLIQLSRRNICLFPDWRDLPLGLSH